MSRVEFVPDTNSSLLFPLPHSVHPRMCLPRQRYPPPPARAATPPPGLHHAACNHLPQTVPGGQLVPGRLHVGDDGGAGAHGRLARRAPAPHELPVGSCEQAASAPACTPVLRKPPAGGSWRGERAFVTLKPPAGDFKGAWCMRGRARWVLHHALILLSGRESERGPRGLPSLQAQNQPTAGPARAAQAGAAVRARRVWRHCVRGQEAVPRGCAAGRTRLRAHRCLACLLARLTASPHPPAACLLAHAACALPKLSALIPDSRLRHRQSTPDHPTVPRQQRPLTPLLARMHRAGRRHVPAEGAAPAATVGPKRQGPPAAAGRGAGAGGPLSARLLRGAQPNAGVRKAGLACRLLGRALPFSCTSVARLVPSSPAPAASPAMQRAACVLPWHTSSRPTARGAAPRRLRSCCRQCWGRRRRAPPRRGAGWCCSCGTRWRVRPTNCWRLCLVGRVVGGVRARGRGLGGCVVGMVW